MVRASSLLAFAVLAAGLSAQAPAPVELTFGFWNLENLFDVEDDPDNPGDDEYLPAKEWSEERYRVKLDHLAEVIAAIEPHALGVCEMENRFVLEDLVAHPRLASLGLQVVHRDTADTRGIDLGLLYRAPFALAGGDAAVVLHPVERQGERPSRGVLEVPLAAHGQTLTVLVNHWPSRRSDDDGAYRAVAAEVCRKVIDGRLAAAGPGKDADLLLIGDLNDDPFDRSVREVLGAVRSKRTALERKDPRPLWNAAWCFLGEPDLGTLHYQWNWNVFDQAILSRGMLLAPGFRFVEGSLRVHAPAGMRDQYDRPLPFRKRGDEWVLGYSDHFPIVGRIVVEGAGG